MIVNRTAESKIPRFVLLFLLLQLNFENMDLPGLGIENAGDSHFLSLETVHQVGAIEPEYVIAGGQNQVAAHVFNAVHRASIRSPAHGLGLEHLLMRARKGVNIQGTLAVGNFAVKYS